MPIALLRRVSLVWMAVAGGLAVWLRSANVAPFRLASDWQNQHLGTAFPQTTQWVLGLLLIVPALAMLMYLGRRDEQDVPQDAEQKLLAIRRAGLRLYVLLGGAGLAAVGAMAALLLTLALPVHGGRPVALDLGRAAGAVVGGPTMIVGARPVAGELRYSSAHFGMTQVARFMPVQGVDHYGAPWLVIERADDGLTFDPMSLPTHFDGILVADGLPAAAEAMLRDKALLGNGPDGHYWVLVTQTDFLYGPYWTAASELLFLAVVFLAFASVQFLGMRRVRRP
jgi:hypothetical protein